MYLKVLLVAFVLSCLAMQVLQARGEAVEEGLHLPRVGLGIKDAAILKERWARKWSLLRLLLFVIMHDMMLLQKLQRYCTGPGEQEVALQGSAHRATNMLYKPS